MPKLRLPGGTIMFKADENTTFSPIIISPSSGVSRPAKQRSNVVLPQPDGPNRTRNSPDSISNDTLLRALMPLYVLVRLRTYIFDIERSSSLGLFFA